MGEYNFKEETGDMQFDASGFLKVNVAAGGAGDGAVLDGVSSSIKATVLDLTTSNPQAVAVVDANGDQITSFGGGTQYTEDAAAAANPVGTAPILVRTDTPAGQVSADGDNIAQRGTNYGAAYVTLLDTGGTPVSVGGGTQYTEDAAAAANPVGTAPMLVRQDTPASEVSANGDNIAQRATAYGAAYSQIVTSTGAFVDTFGGGTQYTEDAPAAANPVGTAPILVRTDTPATQVSADGDNVAQRGTNYGAAYVTLLDTGGTPVSVGGGTQYTEDAASAADPIGTMGMMVRADALAAVTSLDGDNIAFRGTNKGELYVKHTDAIPVTDNSGSLTVDAPVGTPVFVRLSDGAAAITALPITDNGGSLTVDGSVAVTNAGTFAVQVDGAALTSLQLIDDAVYASDAALSKTLGIGAVFDDVATVAITENQAGYLRMSSRRALLVEGVSGGTALPVTLTSTTITGTVAVTQSGTWILGANSGVDIGDVTINNAAGASAVNIQDGGNSITVDGTVAFSNTTIAVTNAGTFATQDSQTITDNAGFTDGTSKVFAAGYIYDEVAGTALTENDAAAARINVNRAQVQAIEDGATRGRYATVTASNALKVDGSAVTQPVSLTSTTITGSVAVTNAGTFVVQENGAALTSLQLIDDVIVADNAAFTDGTTKVAMSGFIFDDVAGTALTENDAAAARIDSKRAVVIVGEDATTRTQKWAISAAGALSSNLTQVAGATIAQGNGTAATAIRVALPTDGTGVVGLIAGSAIVGKVGIDQTTPGTTNAISIAQIGSGTAITGGVTGSLGIGGNVAHDGVDAGNPVKVGFRAVSHGATPTAVAAADRTDWLSNIHGIPFVMGGHPNIVTLRLNSTAANTDAAVITVAAGTKIVVTRVSVTVANSTTVDTQVRIGFGTVSTPTTTGVLLSHPGIAPGSGVVEGTGSGILGVGADDEDVRVTSSVPTTGSMDIVISYYLIAS